MTSSTPCNTPLLLQPQYREYVWGGSRLRPEIVPTAEAWVIYEDNRIQNGPLAGQTLAQAAASLGETLLGRRVVQMRGTRFPLLIKLLDCAAWLSLQVHPDDEQARTLEGPDQFGKTEAWHVIEAAPGAALLCGLKTALTGVQLEQAVRRGSLLQHMHSLPVQAGDSILIRAGMVHALGPGLLVYEVQETSDWTYRVWDWDRPASPQRPLHIEKSLAVIKPELAGQLIPPPPDGDGVQHVLTACEYFTLRRLSARSRPIALDTAGESFHALTVLDGRARILPACGEPLELGRFETALLPAALGAYRIAAPDAAPGFQALLASG